jgi:hypothetical protein
MIDLLVLTLLAAPVAAPAAQPQGPPRVVVLEAQADATLIEHPLGQRANGAGPNVFVGRTNQPADFRRRALLRFDIAAALPHNALIEDVRLTLYLSQGDGPPVDVSLHRVLSSWSEGPSTATGGQGAPALPGDVTWLHRSYPGLPWNQVGGDFLSAPTATATVAEPGFYSWEHPQRLTRDARLMLRNPGRNFGWLMVGNEELEGSSRRFDSREFPDPTRRPMLEVRYRLPGPPHQAP